VENMGDVEDGKDALGDWDLEETHSGVGSVIG
jgi:hypothetical protein